MNYETMLVTSAKLDEETTASLVSKFKTLIEENGTIEAVDDWGKRRLAYPINKEEVGVYTLIYFTSGPEFPAELRRVYGITDGVLRSIVIAREEGEEIVLRGRDPRAEEAAAEAKQAAEVAQEAAVEAAVATAEAEVAEEAAEAAAVLAEAAVEVAEAAEEVAEEAAAEAAAQAEEKEEASE